MSRFGFVGPSYTSQSVNADCQMTMNFYPEINESGEGKSAMPMYPTPGKKLFCSLGGGAIRGEITFNGRAFVIAGPNVWEIFSTGTGSLLRGTMINFDTNPVSMVAGGSGSSQQLLIASAGTPYVLNLTSNTLTTVDPAQLANASQVDYVQGFYLALLTNPPDKVQSSNSLDATTWNPAAATLISNYPDAVVAMKALELQPWFLGIKQSAVYFDAGEIPFPFAVSNPPGVIEQGCVAKNTPQVLDNSMFWLGQDARGANICWRASGFTPTRISTHATEFAWSQYPTTTDAIAYTYQDQGHTFYVLYFPSGNATWVYDVATQMWHQRGQWNGVSFDADNAAFHMYVFGKHLVGDPKTGNVYDMSINYLDNAGSMIRRARRAPHISTEDQWIFFEQLQVDMESGLSPQPNLYDGSGNIRSPQASLRWSDDGGHTWSNYYTQDIGTAGQYKQRVIWRRLGRSRDRVFELSCSDPVPYRINDAYLMASPGMGPKERLVKSYAEVA